MSHVFISYSKRNNQYAYRLALRLRSLGFDVWIDKAQLRSSDKWWKSIVVAVKECAAFIVIMTPEAQESEWVQREVFLAINWQKPIFPILLEGENWDILITIHYEDVRNIEGKSTHQSDNLPTPKFYNQLGQHAPTHPVAKGEKGEDVTARIEIDTDKLDPSVRDHVVNPPPLDIPLGRAAVQSAVIAGIFLLITTLVTVLVGPLILDGIRQDASQNATNAAQTRIVLNLATTQTAAALTPSETPTFTHTPSPISTAAPSSTPTPATPVIETRLNTVIRHEPGTNFPIIATTTPGQQFTIIGTDEEGLWLLVELPNGTQGWVTRASVAVYGDQALVSVVTFTPSPPAAATLTPTTSPTPTDTPSFTPTETPRPTVTPRLTQTTSFTPSVIPTDTPSATPHPEEVRYLPANNNLWISERPISVTQMLAFINGDDYANYVLTGSWLDLNPPDEPAPSDAPYRNAIYDLATAFCDWNGAMLPTETQWRSAYSVYPEAFEPNVTEWTQTAANNGGYVTMTLVNNSLQSASSPPASEIIEGDALVGFHCIRATAP
jgi:hypothetical protein